MAVYYLEEPVFDSDHNYFTCIKEENPEIHIVLFHLKPGLPENELIEVQRSLLNDFIRSEGIEEFIGWYYSPMQLSFSDHLQPSLIVYDCMDELASFKFAPPLLKENELKLLNRADIVFTGGQSLFEAKKDKHHNIHSFPSSIDRDHFLSARNNTKDPADQAVIGRPRLGYYGVIDERIDLDLIGDLADKKPEWNFVYVGPVVKIDPATLPQRRNIFYLGSKSYLELPQYLSGWDICLMPFAINESTKFISPTKTPEYLSAGKPVISTEIKDVIYPYGEKGLVHIASTADDFISAAEYEFNNKDFKQWLEKADQYTSELSWDKTWNNMMNLIEQTIELKNNQPVKKNNIYV